MAITYSHTDNRREISKPDPVSIMVAMNQPGWAKTMDITTLQTTTRILKIISKIRNICLPLIAVSFHGTTKDRKAASGT